MERIYTINLYKEWKKVARWKRTKRAINAIRKFMARHMKVNEDKVKIDPWLNIEIWKNSIKNPPRKIKVKAIKDEKGVKVELFEKPKKLLKIERKKERKKKEEKGKKEEKRVEEEKQEKEEEK